jgi:hypothetical protein
MVALTALTAACSSQAGGASATTGATGTGAISIPTSTATAVHTRHPARHRHPGAGHETTQRPAATTRPAPAAGLPASTAVPDTIQTQPRPGSCHARGSGLFSLPDPGCTPGAIDATVTQASIDATICRSGYTKTVRPPESVTEPEKEASLAAYGDSGPLHDYEYDHLVPLELGGARNDPRNLWPEPGATPNPKDALENALRRMVCAGELTLPTAQLTIATNWVAAYRQFVR